MILSHHCYALAEYTDQNPMVIRATLECCIGMFESMEKRYPGIENVKYILDFLDQEPPTAAKVSQARVAGMLVA